MGKLKKTTIKLSLKKKIRMLRKLVCPDQLLLLTNQTKHKIRIQTSPLKNTDLVSTSRPKELGTKRTTAEIAAANAVMNSITWQFQAEKRNRNISSCCPERSGCVYGRRRP